MVIGYLSLNSAIWLYNDYNYYLCSVKGWGSEDMFYFATDPDPTKMLCYVHIFFFIANLSINKVQNIPYF